MLFREFKIQNDAGQSYSLNGDSGIFFHEPTGLGMKDDLKTADLFYGFYHDLQNKSMPSDPITGDLLFINESPYALYRSFANFVVNSKRLILSYKPYGTEEYFCRGRFEYIQKEELEETGILRVPISFVPFTPWYLPRELSMSMRELTGGEMKYSYDYDTKTTYDLVYASPLVGSYSVQLTPSGHINAAMVFDYPGQIENPSLTLVGVNSGNEIGRCDVSGISNGLFFSSLYSDSYVKDSQGNSLLNGVTPGHDPFFRLPLDEPCVLTLTADSLLSESAKVKVYYFFRSV